jgi:putative restriction endonuclease
MPSERTDTEIQRRQALWDSLIAQGGPTNVAPGLLRELGIYGGAQGIWVNKNITGAASPGGVGVAVAVLHNGSSYDDDLSDDGIIYHFPDTDRRGGRDAAETTALHNAFSLQIPIFVITNSHSNATRRDVRVGWVVDIDETGAQCLVNFDDIRRSPTFVSEKVAGEFRLEANRTEIATMARRLKRTPQFAFEVGKRCGWRCAVCPVQVRPLLDAAHIRGVADKGSDDCRNGLILCKNHHAAFDASLISFRPETGVVVFRHEVSADQLGVTVRTLPEPIRPHIDALQWRWKQFGGAMDAAPADPNGHLMRPSRRSRNGPYTSVHPNY